MMRAETQDDSNTVNEAGSSSASVDSMSGIVDAILEVGRQRHALLKKMRDAIKGGDKEQALNLASQLCGLVDEKGNRVN